MRITRQFKDYYDSLQSYGGHDDGLVFVRDPKVYELGRKWQGGTMVEIDTVPLWLRGMFKRLPRASEPHIPQWKPKLTPDGRATPDFNGVKVLFCGKVYSGVTFGNIYSGKDIQTFYDEKSIAKYVESLGRNYRVPLFHEGYFIPQPVPEASEHRVAIATLTQDFLVRKYVVNDNLSQYDFQRAMPPAQAFQELSMFLGNFAPENKPMVQIEDKYKIQEHGFDKWSFRKQGKNSV